MVENISRLCVLKCVDVAEESGACRTVCRDREFMAIHRR